MSRLHLRRPRQQGEGLEQEHDARATGLCGMLFVDVTDDPGLVRCRLCRRRMGTSTPVVDRDVKPENADLSPLPLPFEPKPPVPVLEVIGATTLTARDIRIIERVDAGEDPNERPQWRSLKAAIERTTAIKAGRAPIRSGWKSEYVEPGQGAVRSDDGRDNVIEVDKAIAHAFDDLPQPIMIGTPGLPLRREHAAQLLEDVLREIATAEQLAADLTTDEQHVTETQVSNLVRHGRENVRLVLERKNLIEQRRERSDRGKPRAIEEELMAGRWDVVGWKAIGDVIDRGEGAAKRYAERTEDPLPVHDQLGRVVAVRAELMEWLSRQTTSRKSA